jgi:hypothetical protein
MLPSAAHHRVLESPSIAMLAVLPLSVSSDEAVAALAGWPGSGKNEPSEMEPNRAKRQPSLKEMRSRGPLVVSARVTKANEKMKTASLARKKSGFIPADNNERNQMKQFDYYNSSPSRSRGDEAQISSGIGVNSGPPYVGSYYFTRLPNRTRVTVPAARLRWAVARRGWPGTGRQSNQSVPTTRCRAPAAPA